MNALDSLVDFAALVSTSEASRPGYHGNNVDHNVNLTNTKLDYMSQIFIPPSEGLHLANGKRAVETVQLQSSRAPSLTQQTPSAQTTSHPTSNSHYYGPYEEFFAAPAHSHMSQPFDQFPYQHPGLGLPCIVSEDPSYQSCNCERIAHWNTSYEVDYSLPAEPPSWINAQSQPPLPNHDARFLELQFVLPVEEIPTQQSQCMETACYCRYSPSHHQAISNDYPPVFARHGWGPHASAYDGSVPKSDREWVWMSARGQPEMSCI